MCGPRRQQVAQGPDRGHWFRDRLLVSLEAGQEQRGTEGLRPGRSSVTVLPREACPLVFDGSQQEAEGGVCWERHETAETGDRGSVEVTVISAARILGRKA